jgi:ZIP family zinc transporter
VQWFFELYSWQQALIATLFTWAVTTLGALTVFFCKTSEGKAFSFLMSASAGIMLASTFFSLLLPALDTGGEYSWLLLGGGFLMGGLAIVLTDVITERLHAFSADSKKRGCAVMFAAVTMHNIPEGLAIGVAFGAAVDGQMATIAAVMLAVGIGIQNFPEGMCVAFPLRANGMSRGKSFFLSQLSGSVEIFSGLLGCIAVSVAGGILPWALSFSAGAMLAMVCSELIPESFAESKTKATCGIVLGFVLMMVLDVAFG